MPQPLNGPAILCYHRPTVSPYPNIIACVLSLVALAPLAKSATPATGPSQLVGLAYERLVAEYLDGKWDALETDLAALKDLSEFSPQQRADIAYIRSAMNECRPAWWKQIKQGKKVPFTPILWGKPMPSTYDPAGKGLQINIKDNTPEITVAWKADDMDNPRHAEHGFSQGELTMLGIYMTLGSASAWSAIPLQEQVNLTDDAKMQLSRYLDFRGNLAGVYYGAPRARRWALWLFTAAHMDKYAKMPSVNTRKAIAAMLVGEILSHPDKYPSFKLPAKLDADNAEGKLALHFKDLMEKNAWTVAEDKSLREATTAFAAANDKPIWKTGIITLPNKLQITLEPTQDTQNRPKRDVWTKTQFDKAPH